MSLDLLLRIQEILQEDGGCTGIEIRPLAQVQGALAGPSLIPGADLDTPLLFNRPGKAQAFSCLRADLTHGIQRYADNDQLGSVLGGPREDPIRIPCARFMPKGLEGFGEGPCWIGEGQTDSLITRIYCQHAGHVIHLAARKAPHESVLATAAVG